MKRLNSVLLFSSLIFTSGASFADHLNEGTAALEELTQEALAHSPEITEAKSIVESAKATEKSARGSFFPELSAVGASISNKLDQEKNSGTAVYGRAQWNLYRGGKDRADLSVAQSQSELAEKQAMLVQAGVARQVAQLYYGLLFLTESVALKEKAIGLNQEQLKLARLKKNSGYTSDADVIEFELREATLRSDLKRIAEEQEEKSRELSVLLGRKDLNSKIEVKGHLVRDDRQPKKDIVLSLLGKNSEVLAAEFDLLETQKDQTAARASFMPKVDLDARYGRLANEDRVFTENNNYSVEMRLTVPLFSGFSSVNEVSSARAKVAAKDIAVQRKRLSVNATVENLFSKLSSLVERLDLEEKTLARSEEYYKITVGEYRRGVKNSPDMVAATERQLDARIRNLEYRRDFYLTRLSIEELVGAFPADKTLY